MAEADTMQDYYRAQQYAMAQDDSMAHVQSTSLSSNPYRVSVMPDDVPSMDVSEQTWRDSATNIPEEEASEDSSLNGTHEEMPSPTATKQGMQGVHEPDNHLSKHVLSKFWLRLVLLHGAALEKHSKTASLHPRLWLGIRLMINK